MPICPRCKTHVDALFAPCPTGDGYWSVEEAVDARWSDDLMLGVLVDDRYVVCDVIGRGSIGRVYKGWQVKVGRHVALKLFRLENIIDAQLGFMPRHTIAQAREDAAERFEREAQVLGKLTHPNCVTIYDFGDGGDGTFLYIAMEYVAGLSMRDAVQRGLKLPVMVDILRQTVDALRSAHKLGIVHRDLKPENIIIAFRDHTQEPFVKVLDFGIAKLVGTEGHTGSAGMLFGTPAYMSPEQCAGDSGAIGPHSDIYALGCMAYELVCGKLPFDAPTPQRMIWMHQEEPTPPIAPRQGVDLPDGLAAFITRCMSKAPADRYRDAAEALDALDVALDDAHMHVDAKTSALDPSPATDARDPIAAALLTGPRIPDAPTPEADRRADPVLETRAVAQHTLAGVPTVAPVKAAMARSGGKRTLLIMGAALTSLVCFLVLLFALFYKML